MNPPRINAGIVPHYRKLWSATLVLAALAAMLIVAGVML